MAIMPQGLVYGPNMSTEKSKYRTDKPTSPLKELSSDHELAATVTVVGILDQRVF
jgi:hypothetical protein